MQINTLKILMMLMVFSTTLNAQQLTGKNIYTLQYDFIAREASEGMRLFQYKKRLGYLNDQMNIVIPPVFANAQPFKFSRAWIRYTNHGKYGYINKQGKLVVDTLYDDAGDFKAAIAIVSFQKKYGAIDTLGKTIINFKYDFLYSFVDGEKTFAKLNGKYGVINIRGEELSPFIFDDMGVVMEDRAAVKDNKTNLWAIIDDHGTLITTYIYEVVATCSDDRIAVKKQNKYGFINRQGEQVIPFQYDFASSFSYGGVAAVTVNNKSGLINKNNEIIAPLIYDEIGWYFENGLIRAKKNGKICFLDAQGKEHKN